MEEGRTCGFQMKTQPRVIELSRMEMLESGGRLIEGARLATQVSQVRVSLIQINNQVKAWTQC
jgi:hypothetical protein